MSNDYESKWCPMVRMDWMNIGAANISEGNRNPEWSRCIGPECMMWRTETNHIGPELQMTVVKGYCGLAGRP